MQQQRWMPYYPAPPMAYHNPLGLGVYAAPAEPQTSLKAKRAPRGAVPRALQNRVSAQRVRDRQKNHITMLEETVARLEVQNALILKEINEIKSTHAHVLALHNVDNDVKEEPSTPPCLGSLVSTTTEGSEGSFEDSCSQSCPSPSTASTVSDDGSSLSADIDSLLSEDVDLDACLLSLLPPNDQAASLCDVTAPAVPFGFDLSSWAAVAGHGAEEGYSCESAALASPLQQETLFSFLMFSLAVLATSASMWTFFLLATTGRGSKTSYTVTSVCRPEAAVRSARCVPLCGGNSSKDWALALTAYTVS